MHILLINPPWVIQRKYNIWRNVASVMPPLGIAWLAAALERKNHIVLVLDAHAEQLPIEAIPGWIHKHRLPAFDMVGISATTPLVANALKIARLLKNEFPTIQIVLGGVHPTVLPDEVLAENCVDLVVRGEGEETICEIADEKALEAIDGISYRKDGVVVHNHDRKLLSDLDSLPFPAYHLLPMKKYRPAAGAAKRMPAASVLATRGCPGRCTFCYRIFGNRLRVRSGRNIAKEVKHLYEHYGIREICFYDDTFTAVKRVVRDFCRILIEMNLDLTWSCFSRIDTFDEETFRIMKESGCHQIMYGVESNNRTIIQNINKNLNPDRIEHVVHATKKIGMDVRAAFMLGNPGETEKSMAENIKFAIRLDPDLAIFNIATPFPGTEMFQWADKNGYLITKNWENYDLSAPVLNLPTVSADKVVYYYRKAHRRFYLRPGYFWKRLTKLGSREEWVSTMRAARMLLGDFIK